MRVFTEHYCHCNPSWSNRRGSIVIMFYQTEHLAESLFTLTFSILLLSSDLHNPHVRRKMSKREFLRNTKPLLEGITDDFLGLIQP